MSGLLQRVAHAGAKSASGYYGGRVEENRQARLAKMRDAIADENRVDTASRQKEYRQEGWDHNAGLLAAQQERSDAQSLATETKSKEAAAQSTIVDTRYEIIGGDSFQVGYNANGEAIKKIQQQGKGWSKRDDAEVKHLQGQIDKFDEFGALTPKQTEARAKLIGKLEAKFSGPKAKKPDPKQFTEMNPRAAQMLADKITSGDATRKEVLQYAKKNGYKISSGPLFKAIHGQGRADFNKNEPSSAESKPQAPTKAEQTAVSAATAGDTISQNRVKRLEILRKAGMEPPTQGREEPVDVYADETFLKGGAEAIASGAEAVGNAAKWGWDKFDKASTGLLSPVKSAGQFFADSHERKMEERAVRHSRQPQGDEGQVVRSIGEFMEAPTYRQALELLENDAVSGEQKEMINAWLVEKYGEGVRK